MEVGKVNNRAGTGILYRFQGNAVEHRVVLKQERSVKDLFLVRYMEGLARFLVNLLQYTVLVIEKHVNKRCIEHGMITNYQLLDMLAVLVLFCHIALNSQHQFQASFTVTLSNDYGNLIVAHWAILLLGSPDVHHGRGALAVTHIENATLEFVEVATVKELRELYRIVLCAICSLFCYRIIMAMGWFVNPQALIGSLQNQGHAVVHVSYGKTGVLFVKDIDKIKE